MITSCLCKCMQGCSDSRSARREAEKIGNTSQQFLLLFVFIFISLSQSGAGMVRSPAVHVLFLEMMKGVSDFTCFKPFLVWVHRSRNPAKKEVVAVVKDPNRTSWPRSTENAPGKTLRAKPRRKTTEMGAARVATPPLPRLQRSRRRSKWKRKWRCYPRLPSRSLSWPWRNQRWKACPPKEGGQGPQGVVGEEGHRSVKLWGNDPPPSSLPNQVQRSRKRAAQRGQRGQQAEPSQERLLVFPPRLQSARPTPTRSPPRIKVAGPRAKMTLRSRKSPRSLQSQKSPIQRKKPRPNQRYFRQMVVYYGNAMEQQSKAMPTSTFEHW